MIIDAKNLILGRMATYAAKQALLLEEVNVINCDLAVVSGKKKVVIQKYKEKTERGDPHHGPFFPRNISGLVRRTIRGMLPFRQTRGREAYKRVKCFVGLPDEFKDKESEKLENASVKRITDTSFMTVGELCKCLK